MVRIVISCCLLMATALPVDAQSLAEVARQEEVRRAQVRVKSRVFTNSSLSPAPGESPVAPPPAVQETSATPATPTNSSAAAVTAPVVAQLDEREWRGRAASLRAQVALAAKELAALAGVSHDDPKEQALLDSVRQRRQAALTRAEDALRLFEIQADAAKVPKAWLMVDRD